MVHNGKERGSMESYLLKNIEVSPDSLVVEGFHKPGSLTRCSGAWIHAAGSAMLEGGEYVVKPSQQWIWLAVEEGQVDVTWEDSRLILKAEQTCLPYFSARARMISF